MELSLHNENNKDNRRMIRMIGRQALLIIYHSTVQICAQVSELQILNTNKIIK